MKTMGFVKACQETFGRKPDQTLQQFGQEIKAAWAADADFWVREFAKIGIEIQSVAA